LSHDGHHRVYLCLRDRDPEGARLTMLQHLSEVADLTRSRHPSF
jgi:DNA-binding FadR family transcriptional regulator